MKRKHFLYTAIGAASFASLAGCNDTEPPPTKCEQSDQQEIQWKMATSWSESLDTVYGGAQTLCQLVSDMTNRRFTISLFPANNPVDGLKVLDAVEKGHVECGHTASYYYIDKELALGFATGAPFGLNAQQQNAWLYYGGGLEAIQSIYKEEFNVINFPAGNTGMQMGGWFNREINTIQDFQGLRMRIPGFGSHVMAQFGVEVHNIASNQIYQALKDKTIDAAEWIGPHDDLKLGLNKVAKYYYYPGWWEPATTFDVLVNLDKWNELPPDYQQIFKTAAFEVNARMVANYNSLNRKAIIRLLKDNNIKVIPYTKEIINQAREKTNELYQDYARTYPTFRRVYEKWNNFRKEIDQLHDDLNAPEFRDFYMYKKLF